MGPRETGDLFEDLAPDDGSNLPPPVGMSAALGGQDGDLSLADFAERAYLDLRSLRGQGPRIARPLRRDEAGAASNSLRHGSHVALRCGQAGEVCPGWWAMCWVSFTRMETSLPTTRWFAWPRASRCGIP